MTTNLDILAGTARSAAAARALIDLYPDRSVQQCIEDARAVLLALDEHDSIGTQELREAEGTALTQEQEIRDRAIEHASAHVPAATLREWVSAAAAIAAYISTGEVPATERAP